MASREALLELDNDPDMHQLLNDLLSGDAGSAERSWGEGEPLPWEPLEGPTALPLVGWRCINPAHSAPCARCQAAPSEADESSYALVGETPSQNGARALRALVVATPEWRCPQTRRRLAADWVLAGGARAQLAPPLQHCSPSALRRAHLLAMCRAFCFASNLWRRKPTPQHPPRAPRAAALALAPAQSLAAPVSAQAFVSFLKALEPAYAAGVVPFRESSLLAQAVASMEPAHLRAAHAAQFALFSRLCNRAAVALRVQAAAANRWLAACAPGSDAAKRPAWTALPAQGLPVETFIRFTNRVLYEGVAPQLPPPDSPTHAAAQELRAAIVAGGDVDTRILGALELLKAEPLPEFLQAFAAAATFWADWTDEWANTFVLRGEWATQLELSATRLSDEQVAAPGQLLCVTAAQEEAIESMISDLRQCTLQLA